MDPAKKIIGQYDDEVKKEVNKAKKPGVVKSTNQVVKNIL